MTTRLSIREAVDQFIAQTEQQVIDTFNVCIRLIAESVRTGSTLTGSPGVPTDTNAAKNSILDEKLGKLRWRIAGTGVGLNEKTGKMQKVTYLVHIEQNIRGVVFANGGAHFFEKTVNGFPKILEAAIAEVTR